MISTISSGVNFQIRAGLSGYVAEMAGAFVCASLGIVPTVRHADYIAAWLEVLRDDNRAIVRAASQASKAADYILSFLPKDAHPLPTPAHTDEREAA